MSTTTRLLGFLSVLLVACGSGGIRAPEGSHTAEGPRAEGPSQIRIRRLLVAYEGATGALSSVTRSREEALERAQMLVGMGRDPSQSFRELITQYADVPPDTDDRSRLRLVVRGQTDLSEVEQDAAFDLDVGQITRPVETTAGYALILREPDPTEAEAGPEQIGARHILFSFVGSSRAADTVSRTREEAQSLAHQIVAQARDDPTQWEHLHHEYSDEPNSPAGGDLGVFARGQMVPAFDRAAFGLDVDEISDPIESEFGFHVIQRTR